MSFRKYLASFVVGLLVVSTVGCSASPTCIDSGTCSEGTTCTADTDCASQACVISFRDRFDGVGQGVCGLACASDADCTGGFRCSHVEPNPNVCLPPCSGVDGTYEGTICVDGVESSCAYAPAGFACGECCNPWDGTDTCNCGATEFCDIFGTNVCEPRGALGDDCTANEECLSGNCSRLVDSWENLTPGYCQPSVGTACTTANCRVCANSNTATPYCHLSCDFKSDCPTNHDCLGTKDADNHWNGSCYQLCSGTCPSGYSCTYTSDYTIRYCRPN